MRNEPSGDHVQGKRIFAFLASRHGGLQSAVFLFSFFIKIYFRFQNLQEYTPAAPLRGGRGFSAKILRNSLQKNPWRTGRPTAGRPAPQAARQRSGRLPPIYKGLAAPHPLICLTKNPEKRKEKEGGRGEVRERQSGEALSDFQAGDCR